MEMKTNEIIYPTTHEIEKLLDKWDIDDENSWDYDSTRQNVKKAILAYKKLIVKKNKTKQDEHRS
jgi:hypothetical protein